MEREVREKVIDYIFSVSDSEFEISQIKPKMSLRDDLLLDSIAAMELVMEIEDMFEILLTEQEIVKLQTVGDVFELIEIKKKESITKEISARE